jgi:tetratricopeptide (TPR) repeat protein
MDLVLKAKGKPFAKGCEGTDVEDLWRCAVTCSETKDKPCLEKTLPKLEEKLPPTSARYQLLRTLEVENSSTNDLKRMGYEKLMQEFPTSPAALGWVSSYWALCEEQNIPPKREITEKIAANYEAMKKDPNRDELGIPLSDMVQMHAELLGQLGRREEAKVAWKEAADVLEGLSKELSSGARGFTIERIGALENSGNFDAALRLAQEYSGKYPKEFTFHYIVANLLERQKKYGEALKSAETAFKYSYGDNKIRVATLLARLHLALGDKEGAKKIVESVKKEIQPSAKLDNRTHRYLKKLEAVLQPS